MNQHNKNQSNINFQVCLVITIILLASLSCVVSPQATEEISAQSPEKPQDETNPPFETSTSTATIEPSETPTESVESPENNLLGIEQPIEIDGVSILVTTAYIQESGTDSSEEPILTIEFPSSALMDIDWIGQNSKLICDNEIFDPISTGLAVGEDGRLRAMLLSFKIRNDITPSTCALHIETEDISLKSFFD